MKSGLWIYFDLGINGDYEGMYTWLDQHNAQACGENLAFVRYEAEGDLFEALKADLIDAVAVEGRNHIYVVCRDEVDNVVGRFLIGKRLKAPWAGYAVSEVPEAADYA